ncbi:MAG: oligosaccharide flippase family protein, partial [Clostridia bacterium]
MKSFLKAFATISLISVVTRLISFIFKIYLSRKLGAEILGLYQICFSILGLFSCLSASGIPVTLSRL